jgi:hypothetical protein
MSDCPICKSPLELSPSPHGSRDGTQYSCKLCGNFFLSGILKTSLPSYFARDELASAKFSHALRNMQRSGKEAELMTYTAEEVLKFSLPSPKEQADLLIRWLAESVKGPGDIVKINPDLHRSITGSHSNEAFALVLNHLFDTGLVTGNRRNAKGFDGHASATLSFDGWDHYETLRKGGISYRKAFMAMKFGDQVLNDLLENVFKPKIKQAGFELYKLDDRPVAGLIDDHLRANIQSADFMVADLTHDNHGAYWEAGYAEGLGKPVIYTCESEKFSLHKTHFDTNHHLTVVWSKESPDEAGEKLKATVRATLPHLATQSDT